VGCWARFALFLALLPTVASGYATELLELRGKVLLPEGYRHRMAVVTLFGVTTAYMSHQQVLHNFVFKFRKLEPGPYTIGVSVRGLEELRQTIDVSPGLADPKGRVYVEMSVQLAPRPGAGRTVSVRLLSVPQKARDLYRRALERLEKRDVAHAVTLLEQAVGQAPQFAEALNTLGTIYNQKKDFPKAEEYFRESLRKDPNAYPPLVNLGGVLLAQRNLPEALSYNQKAVDLRPNDALARCQLGWVYLEMGELDKAAPQFQEAKRLDPGHFSRPQLGLADIHARRARPAQAVAELEDYLRRHPDDPGAAKIREEISRLRAGPK
jgi:Tfp pilus assembly protein PilF